MIGCVAYDQTGMLLELAGHRVQALSVGGVETCFQIPALDLSLDIGRCPPGAEHQSTLLLTHTHIDHAAGLPYYVSMRGLQNLKIPKVYCPSGDRETLHTLLECWHKLDADTRRCELIGVEPGDTIPLKQGCFAKAFSSPHRVDTLGYTIVHQVRKLLPELRGRPQSEIADRARAGETVTEMTERPEICFPGDTRIEVVEREPSVTQARLLMLECTFCGPGVSVTKAKRAGHIHLDQIAERASLFKNEVILLTHWSLRHSHDEIRSEVDKRLPAELRDRVQLLLH